MYSFWYKYYVKRRWLVACAILITIPCSRYTNPLSGLTNAPIGIGQDTGDGDIFLITIKETYVARITTKDLPLSDLYAKPKITSAVEAAILGKENFNTLSSEYCSKVCTLKCKNTGKVILWNKPVDILIIQDHPAIRGKYDYRDDQQEVINQGIIKTLAEKAGFGNLSYRVVNLLKCPNEKDNFPKGKSPAQRVLLKCKPYLLAEIERINPTVIISLTTTVTKALGLLKHSNTSNRGEIAGNVVITLHPKALTMIRQNASGAMWSYDYFEVIRRDFEKAAKMARGELKLLSVQEGVEAQKKNVSVCSSIEDVKAVVAFLLNMRDKGLVSLDTETTGLDPMSPDARLITIQFGWRTSLTDGFGNPIYKACVIPLWHRDNTFYDADEAWALLVPVLIDERIFKVLHNGKFDILYIWHTKKVRVRGIKFDTMLLIHDLDSGAQGTYSLKTAIWDFAPDLSIGGYENLLPGLTKNKKKKEVEVDEDGNESEVEEVSGGGDDES